VERRRGPLSREEREFVGKNRSLPVPELALAIRRTPEVVQGLLDEFAASEIPKPPVGLPTHPLALKQELHKSAAYKGLKEEFTRDEMGVFEEEFVRWQQQFKGDTLHTEEIQIIKAIKFDILGRRAMKGRTRAMLSAEAAEEQYRQLLALPAEALTEEVKVKMGEARIAAGIFRGQEAHFTNEITQFETKHQALMKDLKATRDQRINKIEGGRLNWLQLIKSLEDQDVADREARMLELTAAAIGREATRLGSPHAFLDGQVDRPLLNAETVSVDQSPPSPPVQPH
jgi:hypothetical protein